MAEVRLTKFAAGQLAQVAQASDSVRLLSLGIGTAGVPASGIADCNVGVFVAGTSALSFTGSTLIVGQTGWSAVKLYASSGGTVALSPSAIDTLTLSRATNAVALQADAAATSLAYNQATLSSGTGASMTISAQSSSAVGAGGALNLQSGSGAATNGVITLQPGGGACLSLAKSGNVATLFLDSALSSFSLVYAAAGAGAGASITVTAQAGVSAGTGGVMTLSAGGAAGAGIGGALTLGSGASATNGIVALKVGGTERLRLDAVGNLVYQNSSAVIGGMIGGVSLGTVTTTPTSSASNQSQMWNAAGVLTLNGWSGSAFQVPPTGQGAGAPVTVWNVGLSGDRALGSTGHPEVFYDFVDANTTPVPFALTNGAITITAGGASHPGVRTLSTGATASVVVSLSTGNAIINHTLLDSDDWVFEAMVQIPTLSTTGVQEFSACIGFQNETTNATPNAGIFFQYLLNGGSTFWRFGGTGTNSVAVANSTVTVTAGTWCKLRMQKLGSTITFYINGVSVGTNATATTMACSPCFKISSTVGTTAKTMLVDYVKWGSQFSTAR